MKRLIFFSSFESPAPLAAVFGKSLFLFSCFPDSSGFLLEVPKQKSHARKRMAESSNSLLPTAALPASGLRGRPKTFGPLSHWLPRSVFQDRTRALEVNAACSSTAGSGRRRRDRHRAAQGWIARAEFIRRTSRPTLPWPRRERRPATSLWPSAKRNQHCRCRRHPFPPRSPQPLPCKSGSRSSGSEK